MSTAKMSSSYNYGYSPDLGYREYPTYWNNLPPSTVNFYPYIFKQNDSSSPYDQMYIDDVQYLKNAWEGPYYIFNDKLLQGWNGAGINKNQYVVLLSSQMINRKVFNESPSEYTDNTRLYFDCNTLTSSNTEYPIYTGNDLYLNNGVVNSNKLYGDLKVDNVYMPSATTDYHTVSLYNSAPRNNIQFMLDENNNWKIKCGECEQLLDKWTGEDLATADAEWIKPVYNSIGDNYSMQLNYSAYSSVKWFTLTELSGWNRSIDDYLYEDVKNELLISNPELSGKFNREDILSGYTGIWIGKYSQKYVKQFNQAKNTNYDVYKFDNSYYEMKQLGNPLFILSENNTLEELNTRDVLFPAFYYLRTYPKNTFLLSYLKDEIIDNESTTVISSLYLPNSIQANIKFYDKDVYHTVTAIKTEIVTDDITLPSGTYIDLFTNEAKTGIYYCPTIDFWNEPANTYGWYSGLQQATCDCIYPKEIWEANYPSNDESKKHIDENVFTWIDFNLTSDSEVHNNKFVKLYGWTKYGLKTARAFLGLKQVLPDGEYSIFEIPMQFTDGYELENIEVQE